MQREQRLMPDNIPKYVRCYDNKGQSFDRYTVVITGRYRHRTEGEFCILGMSANPFHPQGFGQHQFSEAIIDKPSYSHLGKKVRFTDLPEKCQELVISDYRELWNLQQ